MATTPALEHIATATATTGSFVTINNIPQTYTHLLIFYSYNWASSGQNAHYVSTNLGYGSNSRMGRRGIDYNGRSSGTSNQINTQYYLASNLDAAGIVEFPNYTDSNQKSVHVHFSIPSVEDGYGARFTKWGGNLNQTGAITTVSIGLANTLTKGVVSIYGVI